MSKNKIVANNKDLVRGAINLDLNNGYVLYVSEDGETISRKCIWGTAYEVADISTESFLKSIGFSIDPEYSMLIEDRDFNIIVNLFTFIQDIKVSNLKKLVKAFDEAVSEYSGIDFILGIEPMVLKMLKSRPIPASISA